MTASGWHRKRATPAEAQRRRDYGSKTYRDQRKAAVQLVRSGQAVCWRCRRPVTVGMAWHLGHDDNDRRVIRGVEHASCNLKAAASKGARVVNARRFPRTLPRW